MSPSPSPRRLVPPRKVTRGHVAALTAVAVAAFGLVGLRAVNPPGPTAVVDGEGLRIEVVQPREPDITPGSVMQVGELVDGFQGVPPPLPAVTEVAWSYDEAWADDKEAGRRPARPAAVIFVPAPPPPPEPVAGHEGRWFGFDAPRRDFQAERAARRARLEELDRRRAEAREAWRQERREMADRRLAHAYPASPEPVEAPPLMREAGPPPKEAPPKADLLAHPW